MGTDYLNLVPHLVEAGKFQDFVNAGQTLSSVLSPLDNSLAIYATNLNPPTADDGHTLEDEQSLYIASLDNAPSSGRRLFLTDTLQIFTTMRQLKQDATSKVIHWTSDSEILIHIRKLSIDYSNFIESHWVDASTPALPPETSSSQSSSEHFRKLYTCFSLFVCLFLPEPGDERAPVGETLMVWLNTHFIEPSTEEGVQLSALDRPWEDELFWPYLTRAILRGLSKASVFFLGVLEKHPSEKLQTITSTLIPLVESQPSLVDFKAESDFAFAFRRWREKVKALRIDMDRVPEVDRSDGFDNWWDKLSDIVGILEGRHDVIQRICEDMGADWKEVCVAWCTFVDPRMRRDELFEVAASVIADMPPDPTDPEDMLHASLFTANHTETLHHAHQLDSWLSAHLADIMEFIDLIDSTVDEESEISIRDHYVLSYADHLHSDPALWRVTVDYMYSCGEIGQKRADEVLLRVPLKLHQQNSNLMVDSRIRAGDIVGVLKDVNKTCFEYKREHVRRTVCRIAAQTLVSEKDYGLAVSYCTSAEDWRGLARIVDRVLDEYITSGPRKFTQYALAIAPSVQELRLQSAIQGVFVHRLIFAVRYARFHELVDKQEYEDAAADLLAIFIEDVAPTSWWAVVLCDATKLLRYTPVALFPSSGASLLLQKLEEIFVRTSQGASDDYLAVLIRVLGCRGEKEALERLKTVRLALAQYFSRSLVSGLGRG
ncbi:Nuclear pore complex protein Nup85 [Psilocybe cubensis]|uniref:Nuclear pore complex protein Nup85 n=2 Tax=Psilocybe cubensis TaxID=181762 RepID=A0A8H7XSF5_PSICU|nr:Nuclear pore complex protein Nup85 [Psilocybe cubensis]KAH9479690.1 Nuclear pore complex protein Nup85 [Psilocybe cubensis]